MESLNTRGLQLLNRLETTNYQFRIVGDWRATPAYIAELREAFETFIAALEQQHQRAQDRSA